MSAQGAKICWESVCTSRKAGGLGLWCLQDSNKVFSLKLIWLLFAETGSLWVAWVKHNNIIFGMLIFLLWVLGFGEG